MGEWKTYVHKETGNEVRAKKMTAQEAADQPGLSDFFQEGDYFFGDSGKIMFGSLFDKAFEEKSEEESE